MFGRIIVGLIIILLGGLMVYYSGDLVKTLGRSRWADANLGGTRQMWVLFGFLGVVLGGLILFGIVSLSNPTNMNVTGM